MSEIDKQVDEALARYNIKFAARYIGETVKWEGQAVDHYRVKLGAFETDFYQGLGHRKAIRPMPSYIKGDRYAMDEWKRFHLKPVAPTAATVLYCLLYDASAVDQRFADWANEMGYDTDSRKALAIYEACCDTGRELRKVFTAAQRADLRGMLQEY